MKICITSLYVVLDNFSKEYENWEKSKLIPSGRVRRRKGKLSLGELMTIVVYFYMSPCKDFKNYYLHYLPHKYDNYFKLPSYSRIIQLWPRLILPLSILMQYMRGEEIGIYYIDSSKLAICHNKRTRSNKVFNNIASMGMSSYGWFMGFKLHLIINNKGEIMAIKITKGNRDDRSAAPDLAKGLTGKLYADKGYISKDLFSSLYKRGLRIFTSVRKDMKNYLFDLADKILLRKRSLIESVFNSLKNRMNLEHSRHRSPLNFITHVLACTTAFSLKKFPMYFLSYT